MQSSGSQNGNMLHAASQTRTFRHIAEVTTNFAHTHCLFFSRIASNENKATTHHWILKTKCLIEKQNVSLKIEKFNEKENIRLKNKMLGSGAREGAEKKNLRLTKNRNVSLKIKCVRSLNYRAETSTIRFVDGEFQSMC